MMKALEKPSAGLERQTSQRVEQELYSLSPIPWAYCVSSCVWSYFLFLGEGDIFQERRQ